MQSLYFKALGGGRLQALSGLNGKRIGKRIREGLKDAVAAYGIAASRCGRKTTPKRVKSARKQGRRLIAALEMAELIEMLTHAKRLCRPLERQVRALGKVRDRDMLRELLRRERAGRPLPDATAEIAERLDRKLLRQRHRAAGRVAKRLKRLELRPIKAWLAKAGRGGVARDAVNRGLAESFAQAERGHPRPGKDPHPARKALTRYHEQLLPLHGVLPPDRVDELRPRIVAALGVLHDEEVLFAKWERWVAKKPKRAKSALPLTEILRTDLSKARSEVESLPGFGAKPPRGSGVPAAYRSAAAKGRLTRRNH